MAEVITDAFGWPTGAGVGAKLSLLPGWKGGSEDALLQEVPATLAAVIAEIQSPRASGGTGRRFQPITETRTFDGSGQTTLHVQDIVPGTALAVSCYGTVLEDVVLVAAYNGRGSNVLERQGSLVGSGYPYGASSGTFPRGVQNISVSATWGYAAVVPVDVSEAVRCEVAARIALLKWGGARGMVQRIETESSKIAQSDAITKLTSAPLMWREQFAATVRNYAVTDAPARARVARQMS